MTLVMQVLVKSAEEYHRNNLLVADLQEDEDRMHEEREAKIKQQVIPRKIWQRCSLPPPRLKRAYARTWADVNPEYIHTVCNEEQALAIVEEAYPALKEVYQGLKDPQARIDLWSYLMLYKYGGVFASIDSTCERPLRDMIGQKDDFIAGLQPRISSRILAKQVGMQHHNWPLREFSSQCKNYACFCTGLCLDIQGMARFRDFFADCVSRLVP